MKDLVAEGGYVLASNADEHVKGIMVPLLPGRGRLRSKSGFDAMNAALKQRAERACMASLVATS